MRKLKVVLNALSLVVVAIVRLESDLGYARQWNASISELVGGFTHLCNLLVGEPMCPSLWIVLVVVGVPYCGASDVVREVLVWAKLVV